MAKEIHEKRHRVKMIEQNLESQYQKNNQYEITRNLFATGIYETDSSQGRQ